MNRIWINRGDDQLVADVVNELPTAVPAGWTLGGMGASRRVEKDHVPVPAWINGKFAVHPMLKDDGYTISIAQFGYRLSVDGRVFRNAQDACAVVETFDQALDWESVAQGGRLTPEMVQQLCTGHETLPDSTFHAVRIYPY